MRYHFAHCGWQHSQKNELKPHQKRSWCIAQIDAAFLARMEDILALYALPYNPLYPVICYDERPCFLIGETLAPIAMSEGKAHKEHYAYEKNGSCALLASIEPLSGRRLGQVHAQRTKREYTLFCQELASLYPNAIKIRLVQDNLNTHNASAFYEQLPADQAFALAQRFEFHYTPKGASWLNMIECEFSLVSRQCLDRRIPTQEQLEREVLALLAERDAKSITINWQFSIAVARTTFHKLYTRVQPANQKYQET